MAADVSDDVDAADPVRERQVGEDEIEGALREELQRLAPGARDAQRVSVAPEQAANRELNRRLVLYEKDRRRHVHLRWIPQKSI